MSGLNLALSPEALEQIAVRVAELLAEREQPTPAVDGWLSTKAAAEYLGVTPNALHKLTGKRAIPFEQETPGGKCWFKRSNLDAYRRGSAR